MATTHADTHMNPGWILLMVLCIGVLLSGVTWVIRKTNKKSRKNKLVNDNEALHEWIVQKNALTHEIRHTSGLRRLELVERRNDVQHELRVETRRQYAAWYKQPRLPIRTSVIPQQALDADAHTYRPSTPLTDWNIAGVPRAHLDKCISRAPDFGSPYLTDIADSGNRSNTPLHGWNVPRTPESAYIRNGPPRLPTVRFSTRPLPPQSYWSADTSETSTPRQGLSPENSLRKPLPGTPSQKTTLDCGPGLGITYETWSNEDQPLPTPIDAQTRLRERRDALGALEGSIPAPSESGETYSPLSWLFFLRGSSLKNSGRELPIRPMSLAESGFRDSGGSMMNAVLDAGGPVDLGF